jgi:hypothetical protein
MINTTQQVSLLDHSVELQGQEVRITVLSELSAEQVICSWVEHLGRCRAVSIDATPSPLSPLWRKRLCGQNY